DTTRLQQKSKFGVTKSSAASSSSHPAYRQYSEYELGMAGFNYNIAVMTNWPLLPYGQGLMDAMQRDLAS
ncbi:hypothetical protein A2U01_0082966, partial [Trifolium medium]|nr:hypothetical protein [Trifolium medium]